MPSPSRSHTRHTPRSSETEALLALPFPVFVCSVARLLVHLGYEDVTITKPLYRTSKGRNCQGGFDIEAYQADGLSRMRIIAQVKQHAHPVPRSFVDELRGAMVRHGALQGLLFTAGTFSPTAIQAARYATNSLPVRLIDGVELARLLKAKEVPIRADTDRSKADPSRPNPDRTGETQASFAFPPQEQIEEPTAIPRSLPPLKIVLTIGGSEEQTEHPHLTGA